jgi:hypothetical protein
MLSKAEAEGPSKAQRVAPGLEEYERKYQRWRESIPPLPDHLWPRHEHQEEQLNTKPDRNQDRHRPGYMREYMREYMRRKRAAQKPKKKD